VLDVRGRLSSAPGGNAVVNRATTDEKQTTIEMLVESRAAWWHRAHRADGEPFELECWACTTIRLLEDEDE
jgi:hypothetical protein